MLTRLRYSGRRTPLGFARMLSLAVAFLLPATTTTSGLRADLPPSAGSPEHYILTKLLIVDPPQGEELMLDHKFEQMVNDLGQEEFSERVQVEPTKGMWDIKKCGAIRSCELLSIEIDEVGENFTYIADTRQINATPPDAHPPMHWVVECTFAERNLLSDRAREQEILSTCHIPEMQYFAKQLVAHDHERHGGNR